MLDRWRGIARSTLAYHAVPGKHRRMVRFYGEFLGPGDLGFDIGAHVGSRVRAWRRLGSSVVAVEPQPYCQRVLRAFFGRDPQVRIIAAAVGADVGRAQLAISSATPTVSSLSGSWRSAMAGDPTFRNVRWDDSVDVDVVRLDDLIACFGRPAFCKIDVEGFEAEVLAGLHEPIPALSFEYLPSAHSSALSALERVEGLTHPAVRYRYNYAHLETMRFASPRWLDASELPTLLARFRSTGRPGDIYARLEPVGDHDSASAPASG